MSSTSRQTRVGDTARAGLCYPTVSAQLVSQMDMVPNSQVASLTTCSHGSRVWASVATSWIPRTLR
ncbi:hypothetical protein HAZT_HAZT008715 [Hyalella azteca]|uniref:Uncharacterized protein n=1 Tax=Hyalella azteca TaxID=294128 RepID=A0A6A0H5J7_HYAAZ|nr:hypothetical protein HAZT_HAZT008715 [Hyalella azteca]